MIDPKPGQIYRDIESETARYKIEDIIREFDSPSKKIVILKQLYDSPQFPASSLWTISYEEFTKKIIVKEDMQIDEQWYKKGQEISRFMLML